MNKLSALTCGCVAAGLVASAFFVVPSVAQDASPESPARGERRERDQGPGNVAAAGRYAVTEETTDAEGRRRLERVFHPGQSGTSWQKVYASNVFSGRGSRHTSEADRRASELASNYLREKDEEKRKSMLGEIEVAVREAFDDQVAARQKEIDRLQASLDQMKARLKERKELSDQIIERRVRSLTRQSDKLDWYDDRGNRFPTVEGIPLWQSIRDVRNAPAAVIPPATSLPELRRSLAPAPGAFAPSTPAPGDRGLASPRRDDRRERRESERPFDAEGQNGRDGERDPQRGIR